MQPVTIITAATMAVIASLFYLRSIARRAGIAQAKEPWMVFGVFAGMIAISGLTKDNLWVSLLGLLLAVFGVVYQAHLVLKTARATREKTET